MVRARPILRCFVSRNCMLLLKAYMTYVRPILKYCSHVWSPHHKYLINKNESVQKFFTKRLPGLWNLPYSQRLASLNIHSLEHRRILSDLTLCFKLQQHYCDSSVADSFKVSSTSITKGNGQKLYKEHCSVDVTKNYFFLTESLMFGTVFPHALFLPPVLIVLNIISSLLISVNF